MRQIYAASDYDDELRLKPPLLLWLAVLYLSRAITLPIGSLFGSFAGVNSDAISLLRGLWNWNSLVPSLIAGAVLYAMCRRTPAPTRSVRWIWARAQLFLATAAGLDLVLSLISLIRQGDFDDQSPSSWVVAALDLYFLIYVLAARRVRDTFADLAPAFGRRSEPLMQRDKRVAKPDDAAMQ